MAPVSASTPRQLTWSTPAWEGEVWRERKLKNGKMKPYKAKVSVEAKLFDRRDEAVRHCRENGIPLRKMKMQVLKRAR